VLGNWLDNTTEFIGPLFAECSHCAARRRIINTAIDGYNGEIGVGIVEDVAPHVTWICGECCMAEGSLVASFGYQFEPDAEELERLQDYFDAFLLTHVCGTLRSTVQVAMFDCA
jgi:hypothetical protein